MKRLILAAALALCGILTTKAADVVIISPPNLMNAWQIYVNYRETTHPDLVFEIKNTEEIYTTYSTEANKTAWAGGSYFFKDYALAIHKYIESVYATGTRTVILGAEPPSYGQEVDTSSQIPLRYAVTSYPYARAAAVPTDLYYACMEKTTGEVWDSQCDGYYRGTNPTALDDAIDITPDLVVMRFPLSASNASAVMTSYVAKLTAAESPTFTGRYRYQLVGNKAKSVSSFIFGRYRENTSSQYLAEYSFFDGEGNLFDELRTGERKDLEVIPRYMGSQVFAKSRAVRESVPAAGPYLRNTVNNYDMIYANTVNQGGEGYYAYGHGETAGLEDGLYSTSGIAGMTGVYKFCFAAGPCYTGELDAQTECAAEKGILLQSGGFLVSYNNLRQGLSVAGDERKGEEKGLRFDCWSAFLDRRISAYIHGEYDNQEYTAGEAFMKARIDYANNLASMPDDDASNVDASFYALAELVGLGDPFVTLTPQADFVWTGAADGGTWSASVPSWDTAYTVNNAATSAEETGVPFGTARHVYAMTGASSATYTIPDGEEYSASELVFYGPANGAFTLTGGKFRAMSKTVVSNAKTLTWEAEGGTAHNGVQFTGGNGTLVLPGTATRYFGTKFQNVAAIDVPGSNVTLDFGSESAISSALNFRSAAGNRNTVTNIVRSSLGKATPNLAADKTIVVENGTLRLEGSGLLQTTANAQPALVATNATVIVGTPPTWGENVVSREVNLAGSDLVVDYHNTTFGDSIPWCVRATSSSSSFKMTENAINEWVNYEDLVMSGSINFVVEDGATMQIPLAGRPSSVTVSANLAPTGRLLFETTASVLQGAKTTRVALCNVASGAANTPFTTQVDFCTASGIPLPKDGLYTYAENGVVYVSGTPGGDPDEPDNPDNPDEPDEPVVEPKPAADAYGLEFGFLFTGATDGSWTKAENWTVNEEYQADVGPTLSTVVPAVKATESITNTAYAALLFDGYRMSGNVSADLDGKKLVTSPNSDDLDKRIEGWAMKFALTNNVRVVLGKLRKIQGTTRIVVDETSQLVVDHFGGGAGDYDKEYYVNSPSGILFNVAYNPSSAGTFSYYLGSDGSVQYQALSGTASTHTITSLALDLGDSSLTGRAVMTRKLIGFTSNSHTINANGATVTAFDSAGNVTATGAASVTESDAVGTYAFRLGNDGYYVDYVARAEAPVVVVVTDFTATITGDVTWSTKSGTTAWSGIWENDADNTLTLTNEAESCTFTLDAALTAQTVKIVGAGTLEFTGDGTVSAALDLSEFTGTLVIDRLASRWTTITTGPQTTIDLATHGFVGGTLTQPLTLAEGTTLRFAKGTLMSYPGFEGWRMNNLVLPSANLDGVVIVIDLDDTERALVGVTHQVFAMQGDHMSDAFVIGSSMNVPGQSKWVIDEEYTDYDSRAQSTYFYFRSEAAPLPPVPVWPEAWNGGEPSNPTMQAAFDEWNATYSVTDYSATGVESAFLLGIEPTGAEPTLSVDSITVVTNTTVEITTNPSLANVKGKVYLLDGATPALMTGTNAATVVEGKATIQKGAADAKRFYQIKIGY